MYFAATIPQKMLISQRNPRFLPFLSGCCSETEVFEQPYYMPCLKFIPIRIRQSIHFRLRHTRPARGRPKTVRPSAQPIGFETAPAIIVFIFIFVNSFSKIFTKFSKNGV
jgi:hypothetical protein